MVDKTPIKKIKLAEYDLGTTLGTGKEKLTQDHLEESESLKIRSQEFIPLLK
jgi:hypothetical protein